MARVLLLVPPLFPEELFIRGAQETASKLPSLGVAHIAAYLRQHGHESAIHDGIAQPEPRDAMVDRIARYDVAGITATSAYASRCSELIRRCRDRGVTTPRVVGGPHVPAMPRHLLDQGADYAVIGEGGQTLLELVEHLAAGRGAPTHIPGLMNRDGGKPVATGRRPRIMPLDCIPLPARDLLPMRLYSTSPARPSNFPSHSMFTPRGCPGICSFCDHRTIGASIRSFSLERILEAFFVLRDRYGARDVSVWDGNFTSNKELLLSVCEELVRRRFGLSFNVESRINLVDRDILTAFKRAGCTFIAYGIESASQRVLDRAKKRLTKEDIREKVRLTKKNRHPHAWLFPDGAAGRNPGRYPSDPRLRPGTRCGDRHLHDVSAPARDPRLPPGTQKRHLRGPGVFPARRAARIQFSRKSGVRARGHDRGRAAGHPQIRLQPLLLPARQDLRHRVSVRSPRELATPAKSGLGLLRNLFFKF